MADDTNWKRPVRNLKKTQPVLLVQEKRRKAEPQERGIDWAWITTVILATVSLSMITYVILKVCGA
jgi:hypothetical protein